MVGDHLHAHADLTVGDLAQRSGVLAGHTWGGDAVLAEAGVIDHVRPRVDRVGRPPGHVGPYLLVVPRRVRDELLQPLVVHAEPFGHRLYRLTRPVGEQPPHVQLALGWLVVAAQRAEHRRGAL